MGLITLFFLGVFSILYVGKGLDKKPDLLVKALDNIHTNLNRLGLWGTVYGLVALVLAPITISNDNMGLLIRVFANLVLIIAALPYSIDFLIGKFQSSLNETLTNEIRNSVGWISRHEKVVGYVIAGFTLLLFSVLFR